MADKLDFQCFDLLIERKIPEKDAFVGLENFETTLESDNCINEVKVFFEENYIWLIGNKGRSKPYSSQVYDTRTKEKTRNPRSENQVELRNQWFGMYLYSMKSLYVAGETKTTLQRIFGDLLKKSIIIRNVYKSKEQFLDELEKIKSIRFIAKHNLLTNITNLFQDTSNDLGLGNPKQIKMSVDYSYADKTTKFVDVMKRLFQQYDSGELTGLVVVGSRTEEDNTIESLFNIKNMGENIQVICDKDEQGMFNTEQVKAALLEKFSVKDE